MTSSHDLKSLCITFQFQFVINLLPFLTANGNFERIFSSSDHLNFLNRFICLKSLYFSGVLSLPFQCRMCIYIVHN